MDVAQMVEARDRQAIPTRPGLRPRPDRLKGDSDVAAVPPRWSTAFSRNPLPPGEAPPATSGTDSQEEYAHDRSKDLRRVRPTDVSPP
jgi:hypothetical protein